MSYDRLDDEDMPGYFLPEESQFRLAKLRDHVRFLVRLAQPRTPDEERAAEPKVRMGELAVCLELLADQVELVLDALSYPAQRTDTTRGARPDATVAVAPDVGRGAFRVTLAQLDQFTQLAETVSAQARVVVAGDTTALAGQALPEVGDTLCDAANAMRALLLQIERQPLREPTPNGVREERTVYAVEWSAPPAGGGRLH
ncbi:XAC0095 family protein [Xanthomonas tesorieronis]|uniref:XAC0095 family protein n=1 Tax=Xanthomonas tesorieronis TaxID=3160839 RepID=UPI0035178A52